MLVRAPRLVGLALIATGAAMFWFMAWQPLVQAKMTGGPVYVYQKLFMAVAMCAVFGLFLLVGGAPVGEAYSGPPRERRHHLLLWPAFFLSMLIGGGIWWWYNTQLTAMGYQAAF